MLKIRIIRVAGAPSVLGSALSGHSATGVTANHALDARSGSSAGTLVVLSSHVERLLRIEYASLRRFTSRNTACSTAWCDRSPILVAGGHFDVAHIADRLAGAGEQVPREILDLVLATMRNYPHSPSPRPYAEVADQPIPQEWDRGRAGAVDLCRLRESLLRLFCTQRGGLAGYRLESIPALTSFHALSSSGDIKSNKLIDFLAG